MGKVGDKATNMKALLIPVIFITVIFAFSGVWLMNAFKDHYHNLLRVETLQYAKNYSHNIIKVDMAQEIINELLEEKLLAAGELAIRNLDSHSNAFLAALAATMNVDEIYSYNQEGILVYSNTGSFIGWFPPDGHPVHTFMHSDEQSLVEDIRQDTETGIYYKYGHFKGTEGHTVQVGVLADKVYQFLGDFDRQALLDEIGETGVVSEISILNGEGTILGSSVHGKIGQVLDNRAALEASYRFGEYGYSEPNGTSEYVVLIPLATEGAVDNVLLVRRSMEEMEIFLSRLMAVGIVVLLGMYIALLYGIGSVRKKNKELIEVAYVDSLTLLPNKAYLYELLHEEIEKEKTKKKALLLINCSNFNLVNTTYGYEDADRMLKELARRLGRLENADRRLFRFMADRFVLYVTDYADQMELTALAKRIETLSTEPFTMQEVKQKMTVQMGVVEIKGSQANVDELLKKAAIAINHLSNGGDGSVAFFDSAMEHKRMREDDIEQELVRAIQEDSPALFLFFQPQLSLKTGRIVGYEALARLQTEAYGNVEPLEFIGIAERRQLIVPLGYHLLTKACRFAAELREMGYPELIVSVNVSGIQLLQEDFSMRVLEIMHKTGLPPSMLELEITETIFLENYSLAKARIKELRKLGLQVALDDFGTGYSSYYRLGELQVNTLKIDRCFIQNIRQMDRKALITGDIISMAHKFDLKVIAEGVEHEEEKNYLISYGCDIMQGYLFSKPLSKSKALALLENKGRIG